MNNIKEFTKNEDIFNELLKNKDFLSFMPVVNKNTDRQYNVHSLNSNSPEKILIELNKFEHLRVRVRIEESLFGEYFTITMAVGNVITEYVKIKKATKPVKQSFIQDLFGGKTKEEKRYNAEINGVNYKVKKIVQFLSEMCRGTDFIILNIKNLEEKMNPYFNLYMDKESLGLIKRGLYYSHYGKNSYLFSNNNTFEIGCFQDKHYKVSIIDAKLNEKFDESAVMLKLGMFFCKERVSKISEKDGNKLLSYSGSVSEDKIIELFEYLNNETN